MEDQYGDAGIQGTLLAFLEKNPGCRVFYFNDDLIEPTERARGDSVKTIRSRISGGTNLCRTLETLGRRLPSATRIVVLTDGEYGQVPADLRSRYQLSECLPNAMARKSDIWKLGSAKGGK
ncbi:MAG: VWA domain-containing protein [Deltaproteobacteria bacterium]|nr:VWA domain-containing protein [Deltaproteobacteria bacterium]